MKITFTYEVINQESASQGDVEDRGFYDPHKGEKYSINDEETLFDIELNPKNYEFSGGLVKAIEEAKKLGCNECECSWVYSSCEKISFSSADPDRNYRTGEETYYAIHFSNFGEKTLRRICQAFGVTVR